MKHRFTSSPRFMHIMPPMLPMLIMKTMKITKSMRSMRTIKPIKSMKHTACIVWVLLVLGLLAGCADDESRAERHRGDTTMTKSEMQEAEHYVQQQGYKVVDYDDTGYEYTLERHMLTELPYMQYWSKLKVEPADYIGQKIRTVVFTVTNHPLDEMEGNSRHQTFVSIMLSEGKVIDGYSWPDYDEPHVGSVYSLQGETLEEMTDMTFAEWTKNWNLKYK